mgnify:CR=1 FL=1
MDARSTPTPTANLDADAWIEAAFNALAEGGIDAVRVDPLAKQLGVTRGSFYWHFKDRAALHAALLREWRTRASYLVFKRLVRSVESAADRLRRIFALPNSSPRATRAARIEMAIRFWAYRDKAAARAVRHIDNTRLRYFTTLFRQHGIADDEAEGRAYLFYTALMAQAMLTGDRKHAEFSEAFLLMS